MNTMKRLFFYLIFISVFITACAVKQKTILYQDTTPTIPTQNLVSVRSIIDGDTTQLNNPEIIQSISMQLNTAKFDGIWKSFLWDELQLVYSDSVIVFKSNGFVFAQKNSLFFYELPTDLQKLWFSE